MKIRDLKEGEVYIIIRTEGYEHFEIVGVYASKVSVEQSYLKVQNETGRNEEWFDDEDSYGTYQKGSAEYTLSISIEKIIQ